MSKRNSTFLDRTDLVWEWLLNGDATDSSGNWNNWTATNVTWVSSERGYTSEVSSFNWTTSSISIADNSALDLWVAWADFSFSFWMNPDVAPTVGTKNRMLFTKTPWGWDDAYYLNWRYIDASNNALRILISNNWTASELLDVNVVIPLWEWSYIACTMDMSTSTFEVFLNWVSQWTDTWTYTSLYNSSWALYIGQLWNGTLWYDWDLWLVRIYDSILSQSQINSLYQEGLRRFWPTNQLFNNTAFSKYSLPNLEDGKVLEISRPVVSWTYYDQSGNGNDWTNSWATDTALGLNNIMTFDGVADSIKDTAPDTSVELANDFTISLRAKSTSSSTFRWLFQISRDWSGGTYNWFSVVADWANISFWSAITSSTRNYFTTSWVTFNDWNYHHIVVTKSSTDWITIYIDKVAILTDTSSNAKSAVIYTST